MRCGGRGGEWAGLTSGDALNIYAIQRILHRQDLYRAQRREQMRVVPRVCAECSYIPAHNSHLASHDNRRTEKAHQHPRPSSSSQTRSSPPCSARPSGA